MTERQQQRRQRRGAGVAAGVLCVCLTGSGCVAESGAAVGDSRDGDAVRVVRRAADALVEARSSKARTSMEMATGGTRVTIRGEGVYDFQKRRGLLPCGHANSSSSHAGSRSRTASSATGRSIRGSERRSPRV